MIVRSKGQELVTPFYPWLIGPIRGVVRGVPPEQMWKALRWLLPLAFSYVVCTALIFLFEPPHAPWWAFTITMVMVTIRIRSMPQTTMAASVHITMRGAPLSFYIEHLLHHAGLLLTYMIGFIELSSTQVGWAHLLIPVFLAAGLGPMIFRYFFQPR